MPGISLDDGGAWDDSALIDSWDAAVAEYQKYHSIHSQGKRLEDVLGEEERRLLREEHGDVIEASHAGKLEAGGRAQQNVLSPPRAPAAAPNATDSLQSQEPAGSGCADADADADAQRPGAQAHDGALDASMLQPILGTVPDEQLRNVMMSWYYAGYYTGLYTQRGQQQQTSSSSSSSSSRGEEQQK